VEVVPRRAGEGWVFHIVDFLTLCYGVPTDDAAHCRWVVARTFCLRFRLQALTDRHDRYGYGYNCPGTVHNHADVRNACFISSTHLSFPVPEYRLTQFAIYSICVCRSSTFTDPRTPFGPDLLMYYRLRKTIPLVLLMMFVGGFWIIESGPLFCRKNKRSRRIELPYQSRE
jgi:hypothetical protein